MFGGRNSDFLCCIFICVLLPFLWREASKLILRQHLLDLFAWFSFWMIIRNVIFIEWNIAISSCSCCDHGDYYYINIITNYIISVVYRVQCFTNTCVNRPRRKKYFYLNDNNSPLLDPAKRKDSLLIRSHINTNSNRVTLGALYSLKTIFFLKEYSDPVMFAKSWQWNQQ